MQEATPARGTSAPKGNSSLSHQTNLADFIPQAGADFVATPSIEELTQRALAYIDIGYAVHLSGPAGTGKTTLALHIASKIGRRCTLLHGDDELRGSDLLGKDAGYRKQSVRDNYVSSILKTEETVSLMWSSNRLTTACEQGHTVIYDEFTRSPAAANNAFLSILEEGILTIPSSASEKNYVRVHADFRAIFTSNPEEYVGVHKSQDALIDRMITLEVSHQDRETELAILRAKSKRSTEEAGLIVDVVRALRDQLGGKNGPTVRAALAIAKILDHRNAKVAYNDPIFVTTCQDVLLYNATRQAGRQYSRSDLEALLRSVLRSVNLAGSSVPSRNTPSAVAAKPVESTKSSTAVTASMMNSKSPTVEGRTTAAIQSIEQKIEEQIEGLSAATSANLADSADAALAVKDAVVRSFPENKVELAKGSDEVNDGNAQRTSISRRLTRPPAFETSDVAVGAVVASK